MPESTSITQIDGVAYIAVDLEEAFGYNPSISDIADRFELASDRVLDSLIDLPQNRRALEWLYEEQTNGPDDASVSAMRRQVREAEETPSFAGSGNRIERRTYRQWRLGIYHVSTILLPLSEEFGLVIERHREEEELSRRIEVETPRLQEAKERGRELHAEFINERRRFNRSLEADVRGYRVATFVKELIEEDSDCEDLLIVTHPLRDEVISDRTDEPQRDIDMFEGRVERFTGRSDATCQQLIAFLESDEVTDYLSKPYLISDEGVATFLSEVTRGMHSVPSGQQYLRQKVKEGLLEESDGETHPVWSRLYEPEPNEMRAASESGDAHEVFGFLKKTNGAVLKILEDYVSTLPESEFDAVRRSIVEPINELAERRVMGFQLTGTTAQLEIETPQGTQRAYVDVLDVEVTETPASRGLSLTVSTLDALGKIADTVNAAWVAIQLKEKVETEEWDWTDMASGANAFAGFGWAAVEVGQASSIINLRQSVLAGLKGACGIVGGTTQAAIGVHDFRSNMDAMEPERATADLLLAGGGMLVAGGAAFSWAGGVTSILIPIGLGVSALGAGLKLFLGDSGKEKYIKGTRYYPFWDEQEASDKYYLVRHGWEVSIEQDEGWREAFLQGDEEEMEAKTHFYRVIQVEFAGDHEIDMEVELYDTDGFLRDQLELDGSSVWSLPVKHSIGRFQIPASSAVLEEAGHRIPDLEARLYVREGGERQKVCDVPWSV